MLGKLRLRPDLSLLLSLLLAVLLNPVLDHGDWRRLVLGAITFVPVILSTVRLSQIRVWVWPSALLMVGSLIFLVTGDIFRSRALLGIKWGFLAAFFALTAFGLFSYLKNARCITSAHLYTAVSIYLLIGYTWAALYCAWDVFYPGSIQLGSHAADHQSQLLYFSLVTLSTIGYGDVVPLSGETRMLAALEGVTGVLYVAITVGILVSSYRSGVSDQHGA